MSEADLRARLEAVRSVPLQPTSAPDGVRQNSYSRGWTDAINAVRAALSAADQPEPERVEPDSPLGRLFDYLTQPEPPASDEPARNRCTCDRAKEGAAFHHPTCPSYISDEPARCEHGYTRSHQVLDDFCEWDHDCPGPASDEPADA